jgi:hypothetical protein
VAEIPSGTFNEFYCWGVEEKKSFGGGVLLAQQQMAVFHFKARFKQKGGKTA